MTTLAASGRVDAGTRREASLAYWGGRAVAYAGIAAFTVAQLPDWPSLAIARVTVPGGTAGALVAAALAALVAFACAEQRARLRGGRTLALAAVVVSALCSIDALRAGGGAISAAFAAALALAFERGGTRRTIVVAALTALWCNFSPEGVIAPLIALTFALGATFDGSDEAARRSAWYAVGACALATLATPAFVGLLAQAFGALGFDRSLGGSILALHPIDVAPLAYRIGFPLVVLAFLALGSGARVRAGDAALVVVATWLALANGAFLPIFGVLLAPLLAGAAYETFARRDVRDAAYRWADVVSAASAAALAVCLAIFAAPRADAKLATQPYALAAFAPVNAVPHRFYCANVAWCDYALAHAPRGTTILLGSRVWDFPAATVEAQRTIAHASKGWRGVLDRQKVDVALLRRDRALATLLRMRGDWRVVASDETAELFVRTKALR